MGPLSTFDFPASVPAPVLTNFSLLFTWFSVRRRSSRLNSHSCFRFRLCFRFVFARSLLLANLLPPPWQTPFPSWANLEASFPHLVFILLYICCRQLRWAVNCAACHHQLGFSSRNDDHQHHQRRNHRHYHHRSRHMRGKFPQWP